MKRKQRFCSALIVGAMMLTLTACSTNEAMESTSSIVVEKVPVSSNVSSSLPQPISSTQSNTEDKTSSLTIPIQNASSKIVVSSKPQKVNDSTNIVFKDESTRIIIKGIGSVPIREAYEKGYIRIKIIDGFAYHLNSMNGVDYVFPADIETGITYDGESPIIYTYTDGTTGLEQRDGAKYEYLPGMYREIYLPKDGVGRLIGSTCPICNKKVGQQYYPNSCEQFSRSQYCTQCGKFVEHNTCHSCTSNSSSTHHCSDCGKISGDGTKGTCVQWLMSDVDCPNCGKHVAVRTCHTCVTNGKESLFCSECGKQMGDGTKGTCLSYWTGGDHDCPNCGVTIPQKTCHTCSN